MLAKGGGTTRNRLRAERKSCWIRYEGIIRADRALDALTGECVSYDDLVADESVLLNALSRLYLGAVLHGFQFNQTFRDIRDTVLERRSTEQYKMLSKKIQQSIDSNRVLTPA